MKHERSSEYGQQSWFERKFVSQGYGKLGAYYSHSINGYQVFRYQFLLRCLHQEIKSNIPMAVLDVGCGLGDFLDLLSRHFATNRLTGVDFVEPVIRAGKQIYPKIEFICDRLPRLESVQGRFDLIIASEVLYYLNASEQESAVGRLYDLLPYGGHLFVSSTLAPHTFSVSSLRSLLSPYFDIREEWIQNSRFYLKLRKLLELPHKVRFVSYSKSWPTSYRIAYRILHKPIIGSILMALNRLLVLLTAPILRSEALAEAMTSVGNWIGPQYAGSNVVLLAQKNQKADAE